MGATALDAPFSQLLWIKGAVMTRESTVFEALRVLSVLLITMSTRMPVAPKHTAAMQGLFKLDLSIYWHSRWTSSSDCSASAMGGTLLQWFTCTHVALSATFTTVCVTRSTWKGPSHLFDFQLFLLWSRITTKSPGLTSCRNFSATFPLGSFYLHRNIWQQTRHFLAVIQHVILTHIRWWQPLFTPFYAHEWWPTKQNFKWAQVCFHSFSHSHVHQYNWEGFKPSQTRLFTAFR